MARQRWSFQSLHESARTIINPGGGRGSWRGKPENFANSTRRILDRTIPYAGTGTVLFQFEHWGMTEANRIHRVHMQFEGLNVYSEFDARLDRRVKERGRKFQQLLKQGEYFRVAFGGRDYAVEKPSIDTGVTVRCTCFAGDTLIPLADGHSVPIRDLVGRAEFFVYSFDRKSGGVRIGRGHSCRKTGTNQTMVKVVLDTGRAIRCTPDHLFLMKDGSMKEAGALQVGDSLEPLYRKVSEPGNSLVGYEQVYQTKQQRWVYTHVLSDMWNAAHGSARKVPGTVVPLDMGLSANHKVVAVEFSGYGDVYCFTVDDYANFAVDAGNGVDCSSGVFVSNCSDAYFRWNWWNHDEGALFGPRPRPYVRKTRDRPSVNPEHVAGLCKHLVNSMLLMETSGYLKPGSKSYAGLAT